MIVIWYIPSKNQFYARILKSAFISSDYKVGFENSYGHVIVAMFFIFDKKIIQCNSFKEILTYQRENKKLKNRLINKAICLLNKMKGV